MKFQSPAILLYLALSTFVGPASPQGRIAELAKPVTVEVISVEPHKDEKSDKINVKITNPNFYTVCFSSRGPWDAKTISQRSKTLKSGYWVDYGFDWCGTGIKEWEIRPGKSVHVTLCLDPKLTDQQILGRFYVKDEPRVQSDCLLYTRKAAEEGAVANP